MPFSYRYNNARRKRSKAGKELDELYRRHKIGWAHYNKIHRNIGNWLDKR